MDFLQPFLNSPLFSVGSYQLHLVQLVVAIIIFFITSVFYFIARRYLKKFRLINRLSQQHAKSIVGFIKVFIVLVGILLVLQAMGLPIKTLLGYELLKTGKISITLYNIIVLLLLLFITKLALYFIELGFEENIKDDKSEAGKRRSIFQIVKYGIWVVAIAFFIESLGFSITFIIASLSALLIGLGLGIQQLFNDFVSGIIILFDRSIKVGDIVEVEGEMIGQVEEINLRNSKLISRDDVTVILPNSLFTSEKVINWSHNTFKTRFGVKVGVAYGSDVLKVKQLLVEAAREHPDVEEPVPQVFFRDFGESSLDFEVMFFTQKSFRVEGIKSDIRFAINQKFIENGVVIPFPQRDVHIYK
ncbi:MAG: mechanosensitive ion channel protein MscS [Bacteroidetes bacterium HGW-Bacteroidetes-4]|jgi:small-conductance mechanosensitive channel|nr:MAG: mechanosensitive ion channel protein MscS [Bacteroidetes bacterium HGW-Bacteroidetes-4]